MHVAAPDIDGQSGDPISSLEASTESTEVLVPDVELGMLQQKGECFFADLAADLEDCAMIAGVQRVQLSLVARDLNSGVIVEIAIDLVAQFAGQTQERGVRLGFELSAVIC